MNNLQIFSNEQFGQIRTAEANDKIYFCSSDVAKALGYSDTAKAIKSHCKKDGWVFYPVIDSLGRKQKAKFIDEGNLYRLITHSKLPSAEKFEQWVFDEVLPEIRKSGAYGNLDIQSLISDTVRITTEEVIKKLIPILLMNSSIQQNFATSSTEKKIGKRVKHHSIIEQLDSPLRKVVEEMIFDPRCTYQDIVDYLGEAGISITITSVARYSRRLLPRED